MSDTHQYPLMTPWPSIDERWIVSVANGARHGAAVILVIPPGGGYPVHRTKSVERLVYVIEGSGIILGAGHRSAAESDDSFVLPPGTWHGFTNIGSSAASLLMLFTPVTRFPIDDYEEATGDSHVSADIIRWRLHEVPGRPEISTYENGFENFDVNWDGAKGAEALVLGFARFGTGGTHRWHRHTRADEGGLVLAGRGHSWHEEGVPTGVVPGDNVITKGSTIWHPANVWHTLKMDEGDYIDNVWFYLGASTLKETGYELREWQADKSNHAREPGR